MPSIGSTVVRRQLGRRLRRLRDEAGKTEHDIEGAKLLSRTKLWRIESGKTSVRIGDVRALCWIYGVDAATTSALCDLAVGTLDQGWWEEHGEVVPDWFGLYVGLEAAAAEIQIFEPELVHGLFQTADYARAVCRAGQPGASREDIERHVELRMRRQQDLFRRLPPARLTAVLGAGVLARQVGGAAVMTAQTQHLRDLASRENIDIRILPWSAGAHAAMLGAFAMLDFDERDDPAVVYVELQVGARYLEKPTELDEYRRVFNLTLHQTVPIEEYTP
jgi:transcriptional regulator with XRE-family HTH domain